MTEVWALSQRGTLRASSFGNLQTNGSVQRVERMGETGCVTGEDRLSKPWVFQTKKGSCDCNILKFAVKKIFVNYYLAVAENKGSE